MREEDSKQGMNFASARSNRSEDIIGSRSNLTQITICKIPPPIVYQPVNNLQLGLDLEDTNLIDAYDELNKEWRCILF